MVRFLFKGYMSKFPWQNCLWETFGKLQLLVSFSSQIAFFCLPSREQDSRLRKIHKTFLKGWEKNTIIIPDRNLIVINGAFMRQWRRKLKLYLCKSTCSLKVKRNQKLHTNNKEFLN